MEKRYILDTNIAIYFLQGRLTSKVSDFLKPILKNKANLSVISKIELLSWDEDPDVSQNFVDNSQIFAMEEIVVNICIDIRKKYRVKLPDAIIAATSMAYGFVLITRNGSDFRKIHELNWINPFDD
ncbi:MAG: type II toxin-antitoxin system VapC family toxin [Cyclobacteriaceae bacterium]